MRSPVLDANFSLFNMLNTIGFGTIILVLLLTCIKASRFEKTPCKRACIERIFVMLALALLIINCWISLPAAQQASSRC